MNKNITVDIGCPTGVLLKHKLQGENLNDM